MRNKQVILIFITSLLVMCLSWRCGLKAKDASDNATASVSAEELLNAPTPDGKEQMSPAKQGFVLKSLVEIIENGHYDPKAIDDAMAKNIFEDFLEKLDFGKQIFTQEDITTFKLAIPTIDNQFRDGSTKFFDEVVAKYNERKAQAQNYFADVIKEKYTFTTDEVIQLDGKKLSYAANADALKERWRKTIKYRMLVRYTDLLEVQKAKKDSVKNFVMLSTEKMMDSARVGVKKNMDMYFKNVNKTTNADLFEMYANSLANLEDPHSEFFMPRSKQSFDEQMAGSFYGIGATLQMKENYCTVMSIVTGSPCYKQGSIKVDDKITSVAQGTDEAVDVVGWDVSDIVKLIRGKKNTQVRLTIKHATGTDEIVTLIRDEIKIEETFAKSAIIKYNGEDYGFISLPEFYADFSKEDGRHCADDVRQELVKLKAEKVKGIILDLRYNGGGSLSDVVEIGGYFMGKQPMVLVGSKDAKPKALLPRRNDIVWEGPLVVMTNFASASASEILAGAVQDYNRGIVVGGKTYGKGTVQRPIDLDDVFANPEYAPLGSLKLTLQKFYRVNGKSTQRLGVKPDVQIPDLFMYVDGLESSKNSALAYDEVQKVDYESFTNFNLADVIRDWNTKIKNDAFYKNINMLSAKVKTMQDDQKYFLSEAKYNKQLKEIKAFNKQLELVKDTKDSINIFSLQADKTKVNADTVSQKKNEEWMKFRNKDQQIKDAVSILSNIRLKN